MRRKLRIEDARPTLDLLDVEPPDGEAFAKAIDSFAISTQHAVEGNGGKLAALALDHGTASVSRANGPEIPELTSSVTPPEKEE